MQNDLICHPPSDAYFVDDFDRYVDSLEDVHPCNAKALRVGGVVHMHGQLSTVYPSFDFETYSAVAYELKDGKVRGTGSQGKGGIAVAGTAAYAEHHTTEVMSLAWDMRDGRGARLWVPGMPAPVELINYVASGGVLEAHHAMFEFLIWNIAARRAHGWPVLPLEQLRCSAAKSRRYNLPGGLDAAAKVLGSMPKQKEGHKAMMKLCRPYKWTKKRPAYRVTPAEGWETYVSMYSYNKDDVYAEDDLSARVPDLTPHELEIWQLDQRINVRGMQIDTEALYAALAILEQTEVKYGEELTRITEGAVDGVAKVAEMKKWCVLQGVEIPDIKKETVAEFLEHDLPPVVRRVLEIRAILGAANVKKVRTFIAQKSSDGRVRCQYTYCGADRSGRWSAGGVQLQNITAAGPRTAVCADMTCGRAFGLGDHLRTSQAWGTEVCPHCGSHEWREAEDWKVEHVEDAMVDIKTRDLAHVERTWGDPITAICGTLRGLLTAKVGHDLICCDFSAIEAVVAACLSRCMWRIEVFNDPTACIYTMSASKITGTPIDEYEAYKAANGVAHPDRKKIGKVAELASGFGGGVGAWLAFGCTLSDDDIKAAVLAWRAASPEIVEMWGGQFVTPPGGKPWDGVPGLYGLEGAAVSAVQHPGQRFEYYGISYRVESDILFCGLPSGRNIHYHRPRLTPGSDRFTRKPCVKLSFEQWNTNSQKGPVGWSREETYGGRLFENVVQAVARDLQADAMLRCEAAGYPPVLHTHDEICAEVPEGVGSVEEMQDIMSVRPSWASWWPIRAAGWRHKRYQKD